MAYKNQKKNKIHQAVIRKTNAFMKNKCKYARKHKDDKPLTKQDLERVMKQQGLI